MCLNPNEYSEDYNFSTVLGGDLICLFALPPQDLISLCEVEIGCNVNRVKYVTEMIEEILGVSLSFSK